MDAGVGLGVSQCQPLSTYLDFVAQAYADWKSGRLPSGVLYKVINPGGSWGINLQLAYQDAGLRQLLTAIAKQKPHRFPGGVFRSRN